MRVSEIMTEGVQTVPPTMPAADAWELMRRKRIHHLVVTRNSDVVGILSDRDTGSGVGADVRAGRELSGAVATRTPRNRAGVARGFNHGFRGGHG